MATNVANRENYYGATDTGHTGFSHKGDRMLLSSPACIRVLAYSDDGPSIRISKQGRSAGMSGRRSVAFLPQVGKRGCPEWFRAASDWRSSHPAGRKFL